MDNDDGKQPRIWFDFKGEDLKGYFAKRALWYEGRATYLKELAVKMPKTVTVEDLPEEAQQFYSGRTMQAAEQSINEQVKGAERSARRFRILEKHVNVSITFKLTEQDITSFELTSCL